MFEMMADAREVICEPMTAVSEPMTPFEIESSTETPIVAGGNTSVLVVTSPSREVTSTTSEDATSLGMAEFVKMLLRIESRLLIAELTAGWDSEGIAVTLAIGMAVEAALPRLCS